MMTREEFTNLFKTDGDNISFLKQRVTSIEVAQANDFYAQCEAMKVFNYPVSLVTEYLSVDHIIQSVGAQIVIASCFPIDSAIVLLLKSKDVRVTNIIKQRIKIETHNLNIDCELIL